MHAAQRETLNPTWNEQFTFEVKEGDKCPYYIYVEVYDRDTFGKNEFIGALMLPLNDFVGTKPRRTFRAPLGLGAQCDMGCVGRSSHAGPSSKTGISGVIALEIWTQNIPGLSPERLMCAACHTSSFISQCSRATVPAVLLRAQL